MAMVAMVDAHTLLLFLVLAASALIGTWIGGGMPPRY